MELRGAHVLITGASRGIGAALSRAIAEAGANVSLAARSADVIKPMADELGGAAFPIDLLDPDQVDDLIPRVEQDAGPIDILINNAGLDTGAFLQDLSTEVIRDVVRLNLEAPMVLTRNVLPGMLERQRGHLVFLSSLAGNNGFPGLTPYCGTKAGITNFAASIRLELRDTNIDTTVVSPGPVDTEMWDRLEDKGETFGPVLERLRRLHLIPKTTPGEIADRTVKAIEQERRHVRTPKRLAGTFFLREAPGRVIEAALAGVPLGLRDR